MLTLYTTSEEPCRSFHRCQSIGGSFSVQCKLGNEFANSPTSRVSGGKSAISVKLFSFSTNFLTSAKVSFYRFMSQIFDVCRCRTRIYSKFTDLPPNFKPASPTSTDSSRKILCNRSNNGNSGDSPVRLFFPSISPLQERTPKSIKNRILWWHGCRYFIKDEAPTRSCCRHIHDNNIF